MIHAFRITILALAACSLSCTSSYPRIDADGDGYVEKIDCNDRNFDVNPGALERCDQIDNNCDGKIDLNAVDAKRWYDDQDGDGFGTVNERAMWACLRPGGFSDKAGDCNDEDPAIHPEAQEQCDEIDHNCDGETQYEGMGDLTWYRDLDGDGYGDPATPIMACALPMGASANANDCDDTNVAIYKAAPERCDGVDNNCDSSVDGADAIDRTLWFEDKDQDGYGVATSSVWACTAPAGYSALVGDCNDEVLAIHPGVEEDCSNGIDDNCADGETECTLTGTVSFATADVTFIGEHAYDHAGHSVSSAGDINNDGFADLMIGAHLADNNGTDSGSVYVIHGPVGTGTRSLSSADSIIVGGSIPGVGNWTEMGFSAAAAGDLDGDGIQDLIIGALSRISNPVSLSGGVQLIYELSPGLNPRDWRQAIVTNDTGAQSGWSVAAAGDFDNDGSNDVIIGAPSYRRINAESERGAVYLARGPQASGQMPVMYGRIWGEAYGDRAGYSVAGGSDLNADGIEDLLIGAPGHDGDSENTGASYLIYGPPTTAWNRSQSVAHIGLAQTGTTALPGLKFVGTSTGSQSGHTVALLGDVNGDGAPDIAIGSPFDDSGGARAGAVYVIFGPMPADGTYKLAEIGTRYAGVRIVGAFPGDRAGSSIAPAGDFNGDGIKDLLIGAPHHKGGGFSAGAIYLIYGSPSLPSSLSMADVVFEGRRGSLAGSAVTGTGDVNNDGYDDILVGAQYDNRAGKRAGVAYLFYGRGGTR
jgi:hypothetical protein